MAVDPLRFVGTCGGKRSAAGVSKVSARIWILEAHPVEQFQRLFRPPPGRLNPRSKREGEIGGETSLRWTIQLLELRGSLCCVGRRAGGEVEPAQQVQRERPESGRLLPSTARSHSAARARSS